MKGDGGGLPSPMALEMRIGGRENQFALLRSRRL